MLAKDCLCHSIQNFTIEQTRWCQQQVFWEKNRCIRRSPTVLCILKVSLKSTSITASTNTSWTIYHVICLLYTYFKSENKHLSQWATSEEFAKFSCFVPWFYPRQWVLLLWNSLFWIFYGEIIHFSSLKKKIWDSSMKKLVWHDYCRSN